MITRCSRVASSGMIASQDYFSHVKAVGIPKQQNARAPASAL